MPRIPAYRAKMVGIQPNLLLGGGVPVPDAVNPVVWAAKLFSKKIIVRTKRLSPLGSWGIDAAPPFLGATCFSYEKAGSDRILSRWPITDRTTGRRPKVHDE